MYQTTLREIIEVPRPAADCYRYLLDFSTIEQWDPGVYRAVKRSPGPVQPGTEFDLVLSSFGRRVPMQYRLLQAEAPHQLVLEGVGEGVEAKDIITIVPLTATHCQIDYQADLRLPGLPALSQPLIKPLLNRVGRRAVAGLKRALTAATGPAPRVEAPAQVGWRVLPSAWTFTERGYLAMPDKGLSRFLDGQTIVVTGATGGLGLATACELHRLGARLILLGRQAARLEAARAQIQAYSGHAQEIRLIDVDLTSREALHAAATAILETEKKLDALVNNAGALFHTRMETQDGIEQTLAINLLAPYRLTTLLMPQLAVGRGRVINVSSGGQYLQALDLDDLQWRRRRFDGVKAYAQAKRGLVAINRWWTAQYPQVAFHAMHPGWAATPGVVQALPGFHRVMRPFLRDARMGADTAVWLTAADAAALGSGHFWFDRRPQPTDLTSRTVVADAQVEALQQQLARWA